MNWMLLEEKSLKELVEGGERSRHPKMVFPVESLFLLNNAHKRFPDLLVVAEIELGHLEAGREEDRLLVSHVSTVVASQVPVDIPLQVLLFEGAVFDEDLEHVLQLLEAVLVRPLRLGSPVLHVAAFVELLGCHICHFWWCSVLLLNFHKRL